MNPRTAAIGLAALLGALPGFAAAQSAEEDAELLASPGVDTGASLKLSGFADFTFAKFWSNGDPRWQQRGIPKYGGFSVGNLNLYLDGRLDQRFRSLIEVRFSYLPGGVALQGASDPLANETGLYTGTRTYDYAQLRAKTQWGGIVIERAWLEYRAAQWLTLRGGQFLTPYGVWNVDHGSPTLIDSAPPYPIGQELFPKSQVGLEAYGSLFLGDARLGYHLTFSNGRIGENPQFLDLDANFGLGGRAFLELGWVGELKLGASGYGGKVTQRRQGFDYGPIPNSGSPAPFFLPRTTTATGNELCLGFDMRWDLGRFTFIGEYLMQQLSKEGRTLVDTSPPPSQTSGAVLKNESQPDFTKKGWYALVGYRLPWAIMPFAMYQYVNDSRGEWTHDPKQEAYAVTGGINWRLRPNVVFKASYTHSWWPKTTPDLQNKDPLKWLATQVAWAF